MQREAATEKLAEKLRQKNLETEKWGLAGSGS
jgi:hypothetical protein